MGHFLQSGQRLVTAESLAAGDVTVLEYLDGGGQGEVYRARFADRIVALKWYSPTYWPNDRTLSARLRLAVRYVRPTADYLWPFALVALPAQAGFGGYLMPLMEPRFQKLVHFLYGRIQPAPTFRVLATLGMNLARNLRSLHMAGLCYVDLNYNNIFCDFTTGDIAICDNDNVTTDGIDTPLLGIPPFAAPEVLRDGVRPNSRTDLFALSVILFQMFMISHPLIGRRATGLYDAAAQRRHHGTEPLFIFDPADTSNAPVPGDPELGGEALNYWPIYPQFLRDVFIDAFTRGLHDPNARKTDLEWVAALSRLRDTMFHCSHCGAENFYDQDAVARSGGLANPCWHCKQIPPLPPRLRLQGDCVVLLDAGVRLFPSHLGVSADYAHVLAEAERTGAGVSLKNLGPEKWAVSAPDGGYQEVAPGASLPLVSGLRIYFGRVDGEVTCG
jgi:eukaryotic-like serine/threonine-protein kinase